MPAAKVNPVQSSKEDLLASFVAAAPEPPKGSSSVAANWKADDDVLAKVVAAFTASGAIEGAKDFGSEKEARDAAKPWAPYAEVAASGIEGKSSALRIVTPSENVYHWKWQLVNKRAPKQTPEEKAAAEAAKAAATPEATPAS